MRWIAGAAAAGLFVGVAAGTFFDFGTRFEFGMRGRRSLVQRTTREAGGQTLPAHMAATPAVTAATLAAEADDVFMSALDLALDRPHTRELVAFDALTPHVRELDLSAVADRALASLIFRKGLDLKHAVAGMLADNYHSASSSRSRPTTSRSGRAA